MNFCLHRFSGGVSGDQTVDFLKPCIGEEALVLFLRQGALAGCESHGMGMLRPKMYAICAVALPAGLFFQ